MALIFFDLDGTILLNGEIVKGVPETIKKLKENGHAVAIATGRNPMLVGDLHQQLGIDHLVFANGGYVMSNEHVIREKYIAFDTVKRMMERADNYPFDLTIEYTDEYVAYRKDTEGSDRFSKQFDIPIAKYDHKVYPSRNVYAFVVFDDEVVKDIRPEFPELQFNKTAGIGYDVNFTGGLKAEGVEYLVHHLGYEMKDVYAFGDNYNDVKMIEEVGHGIAMGNAVDALKDVAEYVTDDLDKDGIKNACIKYGLI